MTRDTIYTVIFEKKTYKKLAKNPTTYYLNERANSKNKEVTGSYKWDKLN